MHSWSVQSRLVSDEAGLPHSLLPPSAVCLRTWQIWSRPASLRRNVIDTGSPSEPLTACDEPGDDMFGRYYLLYVCASFVCYQLVSLFVKRETRLNGYHCEPQAGDAKYDRRSATMHETCRVLACTEKSQYTLLDTQHTYW